MKRSSLKFFIFIVLIGFYTQIFAQEKLKYQKPPEHLAKLFEAAKTPRVSLNPQHSILLELQQPGYPSIEEVSQPELRIAGLRINPRTNGPSRSYSYNKIIVKNVNSLKEFEFEGLPANSRIENVRWAPNGEFIAFTITHSDKINVWLANIKTKKAQLLNKIAVNDVFRSSPIVWLSDSKSIVLRVVDEERKEAPIKSIVPEGPVIQSNTGGEAPVRTYQDLLKNKSDEEQFTYYASGKIVLLNINGEIQSITDKGIFSSFDVSPDGKYLLLTRIIEPYSYIVPYRRFAQRIEVWDLKGHLVKQIANIPATEKLPKGFDAVRTGIRRVSWRADVPSTLYYVKALDGGNPKNEVEYREQIFSWKAPFNQPELPVLKLKLRFGGIIWGNSKLAIVNEYYRKTRQLITSSFVPGKTGTKKMIFDLNFEDSYSNPGNFELVQNTFGRYVLLMNKNQTKLYLSGEGASPKGNQPFFDEFDIKTNKTKRLWQSKAPHYEFEVAVLDINKSKIVIRRESQSEVPNYYIYDYKNKKDFRQLTHFENPYPSLKGVKSEFIQYERKDGVKLSAKLYLPAGYDARKDGKLPVLLWAYPHEFKSASAAGQLTDSPYRFIRMSQHSPLYWVADGYAVLDNPSFPIIGEGETEPNDKFIEQLVDDAEAAINKIVEMGVADKNRIAVGGHSYGAFMTANLLTHSNLFAAGIARSGAYNRTLTPFGFQSEERTFWEAKEVYYRMSPFMHAEKLNAPLLLIHGQADNNSGTYPMQSERYFAALKGNGKIVRLVMLPNESHGYSSYESIMHMAWEMTEWLNKYVKNKKE